MFPIVHALPTDPIAAFRAGTLNSDHLPLVSEVAGVGDVAIYNVMTRARSTAERTNNGFGATESAAEYDARLGRLALELAEIARAGARVIALQEALLEMRALEALTARLPPGWRSLVAPTAGERFAQVVLTAPPLRATRLTPDVDLGAQAGRVQIVCVRGDGPPVTLANVHLRFDQPAEPALDALWRTPPGRLVVVGDFNRRPSGLNIAGARIVEPPWPSSLVHTDAGVRPDTVDGFVIRAVEPPHPRHWAYAFQCKRSLDHIRARLDAAGPWTWETRDSGYYGDYLSTRPEEGLRLRILEQPDRLAVYIELEPGAKLAKSEIDRILTDLLRHLGATGIEPVVHDL